MIVAMVRTLNEEQNIGAFLMSYRVIADKVLVADGGSEDRTLMIASAYPNVEVRHFEGRTELKKGHWRNNDSDHINFLIEWAKEYDPEWMILDDCDSRPNYKLRNYGREILNVTKANVVMTCRIYLWGADQYFPHMMHLKPVNKYNYMTSLWAWKPETDLWTRDDDFPHYTLMIGDKVAGDLHLSTSVRDLMPPYGLVHYTWASESATEEKIKTHIASGSIPGHKHPLAFAGPLEPLPGWGYE